MTKRVTTTLVEKIWKERKLDKKLIESKKTKFEREKKEARIKLKKEINDEVTRYLNYLANGIRPDWDLLQVKFIAGQGKIFDAQCNFLYDYLTAQGFENVSIDEDCSCEPNGQNNFYIVTFYIPEEK